ncbi:MAG: tetratricopeptide repeat protein [Candidatus Tectimicrobiota bacterium]
MHVPAADPAPQTSATARLAPVLSLEAVIQQAQEQHQQGHLHDAARLYRLALQQDPTCAALHLNLGTVYQAQGALAPARVHYQTALRLQPYSASAHNNLGTILKRQEQPVAALQHYRMAVQLAPDFVEAQTNLGVLLQEQGDLEAAQAAYETALRHRPDDADTHTNFGRLLQLQGHREAALAHYQAALTVQPENAVAHWNRALLWLSQGHLAQGWEAYEWRWRLPFAPRPFALPLWDGSELSGRTILVTAEQGLGDELLFATCVPDVLARAQHCVLECDPRLAALLSRSFPGASVYGVERTQHAWLQQAPPLDVYSPAGSLPRFLRPTLAHFPAQPTWLIPDRQRSACYRATLDTLGAGAKIGIAWRSKRSRQHESRHYTSLEQWHSLLTVPRVHFVNLQYDAPEADIAAVAAAWGIPIHCLPDLDLWHDLDGLAALLSALDLIIAPRTTITALAGSLGRPVWGLTDATENWTEFGTSRCPWFPTMRVVQAPSRTAWGLVLAQVARDLVHWLDSGAAAPALRSRPS